MQAQRVQQDSGAARSLTHAASTKAPTTHKNPSKKPPAAEGTSACVEQQGRFKLPLEQYCTSRQFLQHNRPLGPVVLAAYFVVAWVPRIEQCSPICVVVCS